MSGDFLKRRRDLLTTILELVGAGLIVAGVVSLFGVGVGLIVAGAFVVGVGFLEGRKV